MSADVEMQVDRRCPRRRDNRRLDSGHQHRHLKKAPTELAVRSAKNSGAFDPDDPCVRKGDYQAGPPGCWSIMHRELYSLYFMIETAGRFIPAGLAAVIPTSTRPSPPARRRGTHASRGFLGAKSEPRKLRDKRLRRKPSKNWRRRSAIPPAKPAAPPRLSSA